MVDLRFIKPLDLETLERLFSAHSCVVIAEETYSIGGVGEQLSKFAFDVNKGLDWIHIAIPDIYVPQGARDEQLRYVGLSSDEVVKRVSEHFERAIG